MAVIGFNSASLKPCGSGPAKMARCTSVLTDSGYLLMVNEDPALITLAGAADAVIAQCLLGIGNAAINVFGFCHSQSSSGKLSLALPSY